MSVLAKPACGWTGLIDSYRKWLPVTSTTPPLTLLEGNTPLLKSHVLSAKTGCKVFLKLEGANPTGSFKDRGMVMAVAKALEEGSRTVVCASTGNTSASAAAYAARAGIDAIILIPDGYVALGKLAQAMMYGARIIAVKGNFDEALEIVRELAQVSPVTVVNSINPFRLEGQQTAAFEVCDVLGHAPDHLCIPVGNAGNISAYWKGFKNYQAAGVIEKLPEMHGVQAAGAAALVLGHSIERPETFATAIRIGKPASAHLAIQAIEESQGSVRAVTDDEIRNAYVLLGREGIFAEPASCASVAGMLKFHQLGGFNPGETVVCVLTGNGLKDPDSAIASAQTPVQVVACELVAVQEALWAKV